jgi:hypothetical protein
MRRAAIALIAVMMCAGYSFGQSNGLPQWKVIKEFHVMDQTAGVPLTILFTPTQNGLYRLSMYVSASTDIRQLTGWDMFVYWNDQTGLPAQFLLGADLTGGSTYQADSTLFSPQIGKPVAVYVQTGNPPPQDASYDFAVVIEKLTH